MTEPRPTWNTGVEGWWNAMDAGRRWLEQLGEQVQQGGFARVEPEDLGHLVQAIELVEARSQRAEESGAALAERLDRLEARMGELVEQVGLVARAVSVLGARLDAAPAKPVESAPPVAKQPARKPAAKKPAAGEP